MVLDQLHLVNNSRREIKISVALITKIFKLTEVVVMKTYLEKTNGYKTIYNFLDSRKDFIVLGLCGKTGSGITTVANILQQKFGQLKLPQSSDSVGDIKESCEYRILYTYAQKNWHSFYRVKASSLITAHVLDEGENEFSNFLKNLFPKLIESNISAKANQIISEFFNGNMIFSLKTEFKFDSSGDEVDIESWFSRDQMPQKNGQEISFIPCSNPAFNLQDEIIAPKEVGVLAIENEKINFKYDSINFSVSFMAKDLYRLFKIYKQYRERKTGFKNPLLICLLQNFIYNYLPKHCSKLWGKLAQLEHGIEIIALQQLGNNLRISKTPYNNESTSFVPDAYSAIVEDINHSIKLLGAYLTWRKHLSKDISDSLKGEHLHEKRFVVCIDSIKNPYESMYLKNRYTNYYLLGIYTEDNVRYNRMIKNQRFPKSHVEAIDIIEQQSEFKAMWKIANKLYQKIKYLKVDDILKSIGEFLKNKEILANSYQLYREQYNDFYSKPIKSPNNYLQLLLLGNEMLSRFSCSSCSAAELKNQAVKLKNQVSDVLNQFQSDVEAAELSDVVLNAMHTIKRLNLYEELPFILQNVESCLQNADIFINNEPDDSQYLPLKKKLIRYASLIMNPGLVLPSPVERCMQFAYTAKLNSGCISRQVGAAITDGKYHLLSIGWNQQPEGQLPCSYRDLCSLYYHWSPESYSDFERDSQEQLQKSIKEPVTELLSQPECPLTIQGKLPAFCFKDLYNSITGFNNQVHPRSLHAEETAFLNLGQYSADGGVLFTTSSPCELCAKKAMYKGIKKIYYIEPYSGLSFRHVLNIGPPEKRPELLLFTGAVGRAYTQLYTPLMPQKDELEFWLGAKIDANLLKNVKAKISLSVRNQEGGNSGDSAGRFP